ncbi:similar to Saccharomyces cerevisiae YHR008C SOD2 Mitochondrial manganese superoxide dismutase, protects cells against oxygen toxicity [Maudiozyma barnettii]|nr:similar to Saccharomyces cerevisiae YHR008C SOD2 Mitochondrial manganese superoxide dismutase, protects cells against oxygen toxicity [Kazachstania barnettii]
MLSRSTTATFRRLPLAIKTTQVGSLSQTAFVRNKVTLPDLDWDFGALEPHISGQINELHYSKHHQTYVNGFNTAVEQLQDLSAQLAKEPTPAISRQILQVEQNLKFHGGGYTNHCIFWKNLVPEKDGGGQLPKESALAKAIQEQYGSLDPLIASTNAALAGVQGSGWAWIVKNLDNGGKLEVVSTMNQDTVTGKKIPLVAIDAWEHAYYLQYQNKKVDYFKAIWNVINWKEAARRYESEGI